MKNLILWLVAFLSLIACQLNAEAKCERQNQREIKTFKIDLDMPARERFKEVASYYKNEILFMIEQEKGSMNKLVVEVGELIASQLDYFLPYPFNEEIKGMAEALDTGIADVILANFIYEITAFCTSIVTQTKSGHIIHGRNLDYDFPPILQNQTYIAKFYRNKTLLFTSAQVAAYIGIVTGHKHNAFTFSINERDIGKWWYNFLMAILDKKVRPLFMISRDVLENSTDFTQAVTVLSYGDLIAPAYFIVGGLNQDEGVVITRNQLYDVDVWRLNSSSIGIEQWYLLETNYDHWLPPPSKDDRRDPGMKAMNATTQANINTDTLFDVLSLVPVCNNETVYSVVMSAAVEDLDGGFKIIIH